MKLRPTSRPGIRKPTRHLCSARKGAVPYRFVASHHHGTPMAIYLATSRGPSYAPKASEPSPPCPNLIPPAQGSCIGRTGGPTPWRRGCARGILVRKGAIRVRNLFPTSKRSSLKTCSEESVMRVCPKCRKRVPGAGKICRACGAILQDVPDDGPQEWGQAPAEPVPILALLPSLAAKKTMPAGREVLARKPHRRPNHVRRTADRRIRGF